MESDADTIFAIFALVVSVLALILLTLVSLSRNDEVIAVLSSVVPSKSSVRFAASLLSFSNTVTTKIFGWRIFSVRSLVAGILYSILVTGASFLIFAMTRPWETTQHFIDLVLGGVVNPRDPRPRELIYILRFPDGKDIEVPAFGVAWRGFVVFSLINFAFDYLSLCQTRWMIRRVGSTLRSLKAGAAVLLNLASTTFLYVISLSFCFLLTDYIAKYIIFGNSYGVNANLILYSGVLIPIYSFVSYFGRDPIIVTAAAISIPETMTVNFVYISPFYVFADYAFSIWIFYTLSCLCRQKYSYTTSTLQNL